MKTFATSVFKVKQIDFRVLLWIVATTTKICTRDYLMKVQTLHFIISLRKKKEQRGLQKNLHVILHEESLF